MRILKADFLYPGNESLIREGIVVLDQDDRIVDIVDPATRGADWQMLNGREELEALRGGICPGFINAHTHLELSHLLGQLPRHTRLPGFLAAVNAQRAADPEIIGSAIVAGDRAMREAGVVGAGDIANTD
ncbi:MAG TPA: amidohydrolase family protein, partial [Bacteroidia bacterium]|nr:amidohydrolase family protein [Bacteroidia bacterium]